MCLLLWKCANIFFQPVTIGSIYSPNVGFSSFLLHIDEINEIQFLSSSTKVAPLNTHTIFSIAFLTSKKNEQEKETKGSQFTSTGECERAWDNAFHLTIHFFRHTSSFNNSRKEF